MSVESNIGENAIGESAILENAIGEGVREITTEDSDR
jgi:hypothetical protein